MAYVWMLIGSICFAAMALLAESLREEFSFPWIAMVRSGVATILAVTLAVSARAQLVFLKPASLWMRSLVGWASMICGFYALTHYDVEIVLALTNMYPLWVAILSWPMIGVMPTRKTWLALCISCLGMWLVYASSAVPNNTPVQFTHPQTAIPMAIFAGILSGVALINLHRVKHLDTRSIVAHFSGVATALSLVVWCFMPLEHSKLPIGSGSVVSLIGVGIAATLGQLCLTKAFASGAPARVSVVGLSQVVVAALFNWATKQRMPSAGSILGMTLVVAATVWVILSQSSEDEPQA